MSKQDLIKVVQRSINDAAFRRQLTTDTTNALRGYSLTPDEIGALRSRDSGKLTAFGVDTRMSKIFTVDPGTGSATVTSGDGAGRSSIQTPDAAERNTAIIGDPQLSSTSVQSPDAADRNLAFSAGSSSGGVQSPDAADRNLAFSSTGGSEPRDSDPVWIGDLGDQATGAVQSPDAMDRNEAFTGGGGAEPRDTEPTWIGDNDTPTDHTDTGSDGAIHQE